MWVNDIHRSYNMVPFGAMRVGLTRKVALWLGGLPELKTIYLDSMSCTATTISIESAAITWMDSPQSRRLNL